MGVPTAAGEGWAAASRHKQSAPGRRSPFWRYAPLPRIGGVCPQRGGFYSNYAFAWLGCGTGGIFVNRAFSTSGVATLDTTISRMTAVK